MNTTDIIDADRYRWLRDRFIGADFDWNGDGTAVLLMRIDKRSTVWGSLDLTVDAAMKAPEEAE